MQIISIIGLFLSSVLLAFQINYAAASFNRIQPKINADMLKKWYGIVGGTAFFGLATAALLFTQMDFEVVRLFLLFLILLIISAIDLKWRIIPDALTVSLGLQQLLFLYAVSQNTVDWFNVGVSVGLFGLLILISYLSKWEFGMGDVKLITVFNLALGISVTLYCVVLGLLLVAIVSIPLMIAKKRTMKTSVPFAPYFTAGLAVFSVLNIII